MNLDGIILIQKPKGVDLFDCTNKVKEAFKMRQVSHIEALEPRVEGVFPIFTGKATKLLRVFKGGIREYVCEVTLGYATATEDITGVITQQKEIKRKPSVKRVEKVLVSMLGEHTQIAPMYSAAQYEGKKLHKYLEEGIEIPIEQRPTRRVEVLEIDLRTEIIRTEADLVKFSFYVKCTDGTFIRSLAVAIGQELGYPAHMSALKRSVVGTFRLDDAADYETLVMRLNILASGGKGMFSFNDKKTQKWFIPYDEVLKTFPKIKVDDELAKLAKRGTPIPLESLEAEAQDRSFMLISESAEPLAIYALEATQMHYRSLAYLGE